MAVSAELQILITAVNKTGDQITGLARQLSTIAIVLKSLNTEKTGSQATKDLAGLSTGAKQAQEELEKTRKIAQSLEGGLQAVGRGVKFLAGGFLALKSVQVVKDLADTAARTQTLGVVLFTIGQNAGYTRVQLETVDQAVQKLGITAQASRQSLSQFIQSGLKLEDASKLARAAQDLAVISGENSSDAFARLITNIQQLDTQGLRFQGLTVDRASADQKYAQQLGVTSSSLTRAQQQQAFLNEVLQKSILLQGTYEAALDTVSKKLSSLDRVQETLKNSLGEGLLPAYTALVDEFTKFLVKITEVSDEMNASSNSAERLGEAVRTIAKAFFGAIEFLVQFGGAIKVLGEAFLALKFVSYLSGLKALQLGIVEAGATTISFTGIIKALNLALRANLLGILLTAAIALVELSDKFSQVKAGITLFASVLVGAFQALKFPVDIAAISIRAFFAAITALFEGKNPITAATAEYAKGFEELRIAAEDNLGVIKQASADTFTSVNTAAGDTKKTLFDLIPAYKAQAEELTRLKNLHEEQSTAQKTADADVTLELIKKQNSLQQYTDKQISARIQTKNLSEAEKALGDAFDAPRAALKLGQKALDDYSTAVDAARVTLKAADTTVRDGKVFNSASLREVEAFKLIYINTLNQVEKHLLSSADAAAILRVNLQTIIKGTKTKDDLNQIIKLFKDTSGSIVDLNKLVTSVKPDINAQFKSFDRKANSGAKDAITERKALLKSQQEISLATLEAAQSKEKLVLQESLAQLERLYTAGKLTVHEYYEAKRKEIESETALETATLQKKLDYVNLEISSAKKNDLKKSEVNSLIAQRITLESQLANKVQELGNKTTDLNAKEILDLKDLEAVTLKTYTTLLDAEGKVFEARRLNLAEEKRIQLKAVKGDDTEGTKQRSNIEETNKLKQLGIDLDQKSAILTNAKNKLSLEESALTNLHSSSLITRVDYEEKVRFIYAQRLVLAQRELEILQQRDPNGINLDIQNQIIDAQKVIGDLQTKNLQLFREYADGINSSLKSTTETFLTDLTSGTLTFEQAFTKAILNISAELSKLAAQDIVKNLFSGVDIGGVVDGKSKKGAGDTLDTLGNNILNIIGLGDKKPSKGAAPTDPLYVADVTKGPNGILDKLIEPNKDLKGVVDTIPDPTQSVLETFFSSVKTGFNSLVNVGASVFNSIGGFITKLFSSASGGGGGGGGFGDLITSGLSFLGFAEGGFVSGAGSATSDSIPAMLSNGEHVTRASQTAKWLPLLNAINSGSLDRTVGLRVPTRPYFASGGLVDVAGMNQNSNPSATQAATPQHIKVINMIESSSVLSEALSTQEGTKAIVNFIRANKSQVKGALG